MGNPESKAVKAYCEIREIYLRILLKEYDPKDYFSNNLEKLCKDARRYEDQLFGMLFLLEKVGEISSEEYDEERSRIVVRFSTYKLFNCFLEDGEVMVWR